MRANALKTAHLKRCFAVNRCFTAYFLGTMLLWGTTADTVAEESEPVKKIDPLLAEDRVHELSIFSYMQPLVRGGRSVPVLVTLKIVGPKGLHTFCEYRPRIFEAVLNVITDDEVSARDRNTELSDMEAQMLDEVNYALPDEPVSGIAARAGRLASEFGPEIVHTDRVCKKLDGLVR